MNWKNKVIKKIQNLSDFPYFTKNPAELEYFVNYTGSNGFLLIVSPEEFYFFTDGRYFDAYQRYFSENIGLLSGDKKISDWIKEKIKKNQNSIKINPDFLTYAEVMDYRKELKPLKVQKSKNDINRLRVIKTKEEIDSVKKAVQITEEGLCYIFSWIKEGVTEKEAAAELEYYLKLKGADDLSFPSIVLFGENTAFPHGEPSDRKLKNKDVVLIDLGIKLNHFCSDMTRTFVYKEIPNGFKEDYEFLLQIQKEAIASIKPEMKAFLLDKELRKKLKTRNLDSYYTHSLGHGVGIEIHEYPYLSYLKPKETLKKGSLFTIEPGIYKTGKYGIRIEDMVYIDFKGNIEILTDFPKELLIKK